MYHIRVRNSKGKEKLHKIKGDDATVYHASGAEMSLDLLAVTRTSPRESGKTYKQTVFMVPVIEVISCEYKEKGEDNESDIRVLPGDTQTSAD
jgi:hypothetical protein